MRLRPSCKAPQSSGNPKDPPPPPPPPPPAAAVYLKRDCSAASAADVASVKAHFQLSLLSQGGAGAGRADHSLQTSELRSFASEGTGNNSWGWTEFVPLLELHDPGRGFLKRDRALLRVDITVEGVERAEAAAA